MLFHVFSPQKEFYGKIIYIRVETVKNKFARMETILDSVIKMETISQ